MNLEEYEHQGRQVHAAFAATVAAILSAAIGAEAGYRLQQVKDRAKQASSLRTKLEQRGLAATTTLESDIKDLAGCRAIFYTNSDVTRFINSGIISANFEVLDVKLHHPGRATEDAAELYISNHYLVALRPDRIALPEYAHFAGLRCEIQIQTILNHAWAEMAHDTIYKVPLLGTFGGKQFDDIKSRMQKVARKYLLPAGYEFQKIASDFQRIVEGKALFDGDALAAIVDAADNNVRAEALERFSENVLPFYDDLQSEYPEISARLVEAAKRARSIPPADIETPFGPLPAKTYREIIKAIADVLSRYRYLDVPATFDALCAICSDTANEEELKPLLELGKALAKYHLQVWRQGGPVVQTMLIERIEVLDDDERRALSRLLTTMLGEMLGSEVSGTTNSSSTVTFHRGVVIASDSLRHVRTGAIGLLKRQFALAEDYEGRASVLQALQTATRHPMSGGYSNELAGLLMNDTRIVIEFQTAVAPTLELELLQATEDRVHRCYRMYAALPEAMSVDPVLVAARTQLADAALAFRDVANANPDFVVYKLLVGFNSIFPPAWEDGEFHYNEAEAYRTQRVDALLGSVDDSSADMWFDRVSRYAETKSDDLATFPVLVGFLERLAETRPAIAMNFVNRLAGPLVNFLPGMLSGLMRSAQHAQALALIDEWLRTGQHVGHVSWYLRFADPFDEALLRRTLDSAIQHGEQLAVRNALIASANQFDTHPGTLIANVLLPAVRYLNSVGNVSWVRMPVFSWLSRSITRALDDTQAAVVLDALVPFPELEYGAEYIAAAIAEKWPALVVDFIGRRQEFARTDAAPRRYDAVPFAVHQLQSPLAVAPEIMLAGARSWFDIDPSGFTYEGGKLLASVFPDLSSGLAERLAALITGRKEPDLAFVLGVLSAFEGRPCIYGLVREIVAVVAPDSPLLSEARAALRQSGVVSGSFGFAELQSGRKALLEGWLADQPAEPVRAFALEQIRELDQWIVAETRSAEASIALRKLEYGEELDGADGE